jgi:hypothetical protein
MVRDLGLADPSVTLRVLLLLIMLLLPSHGLQIFYVVGKAAGCLKLGLF